MIVQRENHTKALELRLQGKTYGEIRNLIGIPKSTLSNWFSKMPLEPKALEILATKQRKGLASLAIFNKERTEKILKENEEARRIHEDMVRNLSEREIMLLGAALYWGEGYKNFNQKRGVYPYVCFANSDPAMIVSFMKFVREFLKVEGKDIRGQVMLYPNLDPEPCVKYWSQLTKVPRENFYYHVFKSSASQNKRPKNLLPYGTLQLRLNKRIHFYKIKGLMDGIVKATA